MATPALRDARAEKKERAMQSFVKHICIRKKGAVYKKLQMAVMERDNWTCQECDHHTEASPHHVIPVGRGGSDVIDNMVCLCAECHAKKH